MEMVDKVNRAEQALSPKKRVLFWILLLLLLSIFAEITSFLAYWVMRGEVFSFSRLHKERALILKRGPPSTLKRMVRYGGRISKMAVHPYLGFVLNPGDDKEFTSLGFAKQSRIFHKRSQDTVIIAIVGGSVAQNFSGDVGSSVLTAELSKSPLFAGKKFAIIRLGLGGFKQPQQLMTINYLLALGAEFDMVINIDGFNEVALHPAENAKKDVFPIFPRNWYMMARRLADPVILPVVGHMTFLQMKRKKWARKFSKPFFRHSVTFNFIWWARDRLLANDIWEGAKLIIEYNPKRSDYAATGPRKRFSTEQEVFEELASIWRRCSIQLHRLCKANHIHYYHFLQPNQYISGTKPMGAEEKKIALKPTQIYREGAVKGYPILIRDGGKLLREGVHYRDLTRIFSEVKEPVYMDDCCHFNNRGKEIIGKAIAESILQSLQSK
jgi:hypothetical protein